MYHYCFICYLGSSINLVRYGFGGLGGLLFRGCLSGLWDWLFGRGSLGVILWFVLWLGSHNGLCILHYCIYVIGHTYFLIGLVLI